MYADLPPRIGCLQSREVPMERDASGSTPSMLCILPPPVHHSALHTRQRWLARAAPGIRGTTNASAAHLQLLHKLVADLRQLLVVRVLRRQNQRVSALIGTTDNAPTTPRCESNRSGAHRNTDTAKFINEHGPSQPTTHLRVNEALQRHNLLVRLLHFDVEQA